jgi:hypothetical protein
MIDLTRIRSIATLVEMIRDIGFFINEPIIEDIYLNDYKWGQEDLDADREMAAYLLKKVNLRKKSLQNHLNKVNPIKKTSDSPNTGIQEIK